MKTLIDYAEQFIINRAPVTSDDTDQFYRAIFNGCDALPPDVDQPLSDYDPEYINGAANDADHRSRFLAAFLVALRHGLNTCLPVANGSLAERINATARANNRDHFITLIGRLTGDYVKDGARYTFADHYAALGIADDIDEEADPDVIKATLGGAVYNYLQAAVNYFL